MRERIDATDGLVDVQELRIQQNLEGKEFR